jgi:hypothetical protein
MLKKILLFVYNIKVRKLVLLWLHLDRITTIDLPLQQPFCLEYIYQGSQHAFQQIFIFFFNNMKA